MSDMRKLIQQIDCLFENQDDNPTDWSEYQVVEPDSPLYYSWVVGGLRQPISSFGFELEQMQNLLQEKGYDDVLQSREWETLKSIHNKMERVLAGKQ